MHPMYKSSGFRIVVSPCWFSHCFTNLLVQCVERLYNQVLRWTCQYLTLSPEATKGMGRKSEPKSSIWKWKIDILCRNVQDVRSYLVSVQTELPVSQQIYPCPLTWKHLFLPKFWQNCRKKYGKIRWESLWISLPLPSSKPHWAPCLKTILTPKPPSHYQQKAIHPSGVEAHACLIIKNSIFQFLFSWPHLSREAEWLFCISMVLYHIDRVAEVLYQHSTISAAFCIWRTSSACRN